LAHPILARHSFWATFYIVTGRVGRPGHRTWDQVRALAAAGAEIGSHAASRPDLPRLNTVSLYVEVAVSQATLQEQLGRPVLDFCYPAGCDDLAVREEVGRVGYGTAVTERPRLARAGDDLLALPRVRAYGGVTLDGFAKLVECVAPAATRYPAS
jgi:peptidoglycan/xylan/chitin deacetylase (PgdA/CDA1 family)